MATSFLFWNINKRPIDEIVARLASEHDVDILILVENDIPAGQILERLNESNVAYHLTFSAFDNIVIFTRFPSTFLMPLEESRGLSIRSLRLPGLIEISLVVVHFPSKLHWTSDSQYFETTVLARTIHDIETSLGHSRTVVVGDLNMNPFEAGMIAAAGMHAVMTRETAYKRSRVVRGNTYPFFYNPMWGRFGDTTDGPAGTYYDHRSEQATFFWNMFDQVIIRPDLISRFRNEDLKILFSFGGKPLVNARGLPDTSVASDHLPIFFKLNLS